MTILLIFSVIFILSLWGSIAADSSYKYDNWTVPLGVIALIAGLVAFFMIIFIPISRNVSARNIQAMEATRQTVARSRKETIDPLERATLTREVIDWNAWLAKEQYDNSGLWDAYVVDEIQDVRPIE